MLPQEFDTTGTNLFLTDAKAKELKPKVWEIMQANWRNFLEPITDELQLTQLAESVADNLNLYLVENDHTIPEDVFEWAFEFEREVVDNAVS